MKVQSIKTLTLGSGVALGLVMLALNPSPSLARQTHHRDHARHSFVHSRSSGYGFAAGPARVYGGDPINTERDGGVDRP